MDEHPHPPPPPPPPPLPPRPDCPPRLQAWGVFSQLPTKKLKAPPRTAAEIVNGWRDVFSICSADDLALVDAMDAVDGHGLSFWDAMLWATARRAGCRAV